MMRILGLICSCAEATAALDNPITIPMTAIKALTLKPFLGFRIINNPPVGLPMLAPAAGLFHTGTDKGYIESTLRMFISKRHYDSIKIATFEAHANDIEVFYNDSAQTIPMPLLQAAGKKKIFQPVQWN